MDYDSDSIDGVPWRDAPGVRGLSTILSTCISTLFLCVWSALHVDIPHRKSSFRKRLDKFGWIIIGLLAPEFLLWTAFHQFWAARQLYTYAQRTLEAPEPVPSRFVRFCRKVTQGIVSRRLVSFELLRRFTAFF